MSAASAFLDQVLPWTSPTQRQGGNANLSSGGQVPRFTMDGDEALEQHLLNTCIQVAEGVQKIIPAGKLEGLLLAGGYGRGEGGVLETPEGHQPYNDMEFYVFLRGSTLLNDRRFKAKLHHLGEQLSIQAGIEVEFKVLSLAHLRRAPVSMFSYDFVVGHRWIIGSDALFQGCEHHQEAADIPLEEATRLLFNRCSGLLFSVERLRREDFTSEDADFVGRNLAKAQLALGDAILAACGHYHWSCRERHRRFIGFQDGTVFPRTRAVALFSELFTSSALASKLLGAHEAGTAFKLHPRRSTHSREALSVRHHELVTLAWLVWSRLESLRLGQDFSSASDYVLSPSDKCPGSPGWRNALVNMRAFGLSSLFSAQAFRYPRQRLFHTLVWLLWHDSEELADLHQVQRELRSTASNFPGLVRAYEALWHRFN